MLKKSSSVLLSLLLVLALCSCGAAKSQTFKVNVKESDTYCSKEFQVSKQSVTVSSNKDCAIEIVNVSDASDKVSIGYLTPGSSEKVELKEGTTYKIEAGTSSGDLEITVSDVK